MENNNKETFFKLIDILNSNIKNITVEFSFQHSGLAIIKKITNTLNKNTKTPSREYSLKNIIKKLIK